MDDKLFQAILSMDSYNRGNNARIVFGSNVDDSEAINNETRIANAVVFDSANNASGVGFYAIAYQYSIVGNQAIEGDGQVTIAYRGTDEDITPIAKDEFRGHNT